MEKEYDLTESIKYLIYKLLIANGYIVEEVKLPSVEEKSVLKFKGQLLIKAKKQSCQQNTK